MTKRDNVKLPDEFIQVLDAMQLKFSVASWEVANILNYRWEKCRINVVSRHLANGGCERKI